MSRVRQRGCRVASVRRAPPTANVTAHRPAGQQEFSGGREMKPSTLTLSCDLCKFVVVRCRRPGTPNSLNRVSLPCTPPVALVEGMVLSAA